MKKLTAILLITILSVCIFSGCNSENAVDEAYTGTQIELSDSGITIDKKTVSEDSTQPVYVANDIVYYESGHDFKYGEGTDSDAHSKDEADAHTVVHITEAGQYILSGKLSKGQIAVDLGDGAETDPNAVVTLVLDNADITCEVAPAIIFYNVYECGSKDTETAVKDVDTSAAGANVIIADNSENSVNGSYVARIYKPDSVILNEDGTEVEDAKKLHKYDGAFYSKMSMNITGGELGNGVLDIKAANEGLDSELHLTINGGNINIVSGNDGINTNEDNISVTTVNGGSLNILVNGETGEGDGIDSNGWLVINGGSVTAQACAFSGDAGIDSDMGIHINGGKVFATGNMLDRISESKQNYAVFSFENSQNKGVYTLKNQKNETVAENDVSNKFTYLIVSDEALSEGDYTLWNGDKQFEGISQETMGGGMPPMGNPPEMPEDMTRPEGMEHPEMPEGMTRPEGMVPPEIPEGMTRPEGMVPPEIPEGMTRPEGMEQPEMPEGMTRPEMPDGMRNPDNRFENYGTGEISEIFAIKDGGNYFSVKTA